MKRQNWTGLYGKRRKVEEQSSLFWCFYSACADTDLCGNTDPDQFWRPGSEDVTGESHHCDRTL